MSIRDDKTSWSDGYGEMRKRVAELEAENAQLRDRLERAEQERRKLQAEVLRWADEQIESAELWTGEEVDQKQKFHQGEGVDMALRKLSELAAAIERGEVEI